MKDALALARLFCEPPGVPPTFLEPPLSQSVLVRSNALFSAAVEGSPALRYQWNFQGAPLAGQTNDTLIVTNVRAVVVGNYFVVVTNAWGAITSAPALLTVDYGATSTNTVALIGLTNQFWRYNQTATFFDNAWAASNYNDSAWSAPSRALLAVESSATITPFIGTALTLGRPTYYFRTWFNLTTNFPAGTLLRGTTMIDDGAVIFINGKQVQRVRMTTGAYDGNTFATTQPPVGNDASQELFYWLASTNLVRGSNLIAAEVHQVNAGSSDIVWGLQLDALVPVANRPPTITTHPINRTVSNGVNVTFTSAATGNTPLTYRWRRNGTNLGVTGTSLLLTNVQRFSQGAYSVIVSNAFDIAVSTNATLTVLVPPVQFVGGSSGFTAPGQFTLNFLGDVGGVFAIETSTNLVDWTQSGTVTNVTGAAQFTDPAAGDAQRYYRLRLMP